jgi:phosphoserine aminotransferase
MKKVFHTVGPTQLYPQVKDYIAEALEKDIPSLSHRSQGFMDIYANTSSLLRKLLEIPDNFRIFFLSSGTECMERIIENLVENKSFHFVNGSFSQRFYSVAKELGKDSGKAEVEFGRSFDFDEIQIPDDAELICLTQNETSTGVSLDMKEIYKLKEKYPDKLIALDIVTGAPYIKTDFNKIDCAFFSVQKGFGLPGGLGVLIVNQKCIEKAAALKEKGINIGSYHNFITLAENADKNQTAITPNVMNIYLLGKVCEYLNSIGINTIRKETEEKAKLLYDFLDSSEKLKSFVKEVKDRSKTTIVIEVPDENSKMYRDKLAEAGIIVGSGYKEYKEKQIRIGNFPMHTRNDIERIINVLKE